jgi:hypothetical protein
VHALDRSATVAGKNRITRANSVRLILHFCSCHKLGIGRRVSVVCTPVSFSGRPGFKPEPLKSTMLAEIFCGIPKFLKVNYGVFL